MKDSQVAASQCKTLDEIREEFEVFRSEIQELHMEARFYRNILSRGDLLEDLKYVCGFGLGVIRDAFLFSLFLRLARVFDRGKYPPGKEVLSLYSIVASLSAIANRDAVKEIEDLLADPRLEILRELRNKIMVHMDLEIARHKSISGNLKNVDIFDYLPSLAEQVATKIHQLLHNRQGYIWGYVGSDNYTHGIVVGIRDAANLKRNREWMRKYVRNAIAAGDPTALNLASISSAERRLVERS